jgi:hypothetical protein
VIGAVYKKIRFSIEKEEKIDLLPYSASSLRNLFHSHHGRGYPLEKERN